jgi:hemolysin activation/secretion protein
MKRMQGMVLGAAIAGAMVAPVQAQNVPGAALPGQIERQFQPPPQPRAQPGAVQIPEPAQKPPADAAGIKFTLVDLQVNGVKAYKTEDLQANYQSYLNREVSLSDVYAIAAAMTARYRNDGYILSQVLVPAQTVSDGKVRLQAVEGYVAKVTVQSQGAVPPLVTALANKIAAARPLTAAVLERYLLLINDLPGAFARATLTASASEQGASDLVMEFSQRAVSGSLAVDNLSSKALGPERGTASIELNSVLGLQERTGLSAVTSGNRRLQYFSLSHDEQIGSEGGKISVTLSDARSRPDDSSNFIPLDLETSSHSGGISYSYPLLRSRNTNLYLRGGLTAHNGVTDIFQTTQSIDHIRALHLGLTYDRADAYRGINIVDVEFSQGLKGMGASEAGDPNLSRANGKPDFSKLTLYAARLQSLAGPWALLAAVNGQYAGADLLAPELFSLGGEQFVRGYDPSELVGDEGLAAKLELRYAGGQPAGFGYTGYAFWDGGYVRQRTPAASPVSESAASAGLGLRFSFGSRLSGFIEVAKPLTKLVSAEGNRDARGYAGLTLRF